MTDLGSSVLTAQLLASYQVIVIQDVRVAGSFGRHYSTNERDALTQWVMNGGGLLTLTGYQPNPADNENENVNLMLAPFELSYAGENLFPGGTSVSSWDTHPLSAGLGSLRLTGGHLVSGATRFASISKQYDVGRANQKGKGRVVAWGDESVAYGDVYSTADGTRFWLNILAWLTPTAECRVVIPP